MSKSTANWKCTGCGCTDMAACYGGCYWVAPNTCSRCVIDGKLQVPAVNLTGRPRVQGHRGNRRRHQRANHRGNR